MRIKTKSNMKESLKLLELLEESIDRQVENGIYEIERDLILERLRGIYASVISAEAVSEEERVLDALMGVGVVTESEDAEPEIEIERILKEEDEPCVEDEIPAIEEEGVVEEEVAPAEDAAAEEVAAEEEVVVAVEESAVEVIPEEDDEAARVEEAVLSLYDDDEEDDEEVSTPVEEPVVVEEPVAEEEPAVADEQPIEVPLEEPVGEKEPEKEAAPVVLGEVLVEEQTRLGDTFASRVAESHVASVAASGASLRQSINLNDKYVLMRDLFAGDNVFYNNVISELDSFESLDEAMLYIYDNHHWNANSEGARLLMELLSRKLS